MKKNCCLDRNKNRDIRYVDFISPESAVQNHFSTPKN